MGQKQLPNAPFARGTPPWLLRARSERSSGLSFSPLREGDTSVAQQTRAVKLREFAVSVPFARGTPPWL